MALFLGTYNVPTNKKLRVNTTDVTEVYCNGVLVWKYYVPLTPGGLPTAGSKGHWIDTGKHLKYIHVRDANGLVSTRIVPGLGYGEKQGGLFSSLPDAGGNSSTWRETYHIMKWVPTP